MMQLPIVHYFKIKKCIIIIIIAVLLNIWYNPRKLITNHVPDANSHMQIPLSANKMKSTTFYVQVNMVIIAKKQNKQID